MKVVGNRACITVSMVGAVCTVVHYHCSASRGRSCTVLGAGDQCVYIMAVPEEPEDLIVIKF